MRQVVQWQPKKPHVVYWCQHVLWMAKASLKQQLGNYLRKARGEMTFKDFARKTGISNSSLQRLERGEQNLTLGSLETLLRKLNVGLTDVFPSSE